MQKTRHNTERDMTLIVTVLLSAAVLLVMLSVTMSGVLGTRRSVATDTLVFKSAQAAESGLAQFVAAIPNRRLFTGATLPADYCSVPALTRSNNAQQVSSSLLMACLKNPKKGGALPLGSAAVGQGNASLWIQNIRSGRVGSPVKFTFDVLSVGQVGNGEVRVRAQVQARQMALSFLGVPGAVTSHPSVDLKGNASVSGTELGSSDNDGIQNRFARVTALGGNLAGNGVSQALQNGTALTVRGPEATLRRLRGDSHVQLPVSTSPGSTSVSRMATFRVEAGGNGPRLVPVNLPAGNWYLPAGEIDLNRIRNSVLSVAGNVLQVTPTEQFVTGDRISVTVGDRTYSARVRSNPDMRTSPVELTVDGWTCSPGCSGGPSGLIEGAVLRKSTYGVVTAGTYSGDSDEVPGGVLESVDGRPVVPSPLNDALFQKVFGLSPEEVKVGARVVPANSFDGHIDGLTWVTSSSGQVNLNSVKPTGRGILVIDGDLVINQTKGDDCSLGGMIYVRGNLSIHGNLEMCGALVVEGSILDESGHVTGTGSGDTRFGGTGRKVTYDPDLLYEVAADAGGVSLELLPGTWRQE